MVRELSEYACEFLPPMRSMYEIDIWQDEGGTWRAQAPRWFQHCREARWLNLMYGDKTTAAYMSTDEAKRLKGLLRRLNIDGFKCLHCGDDLPYHRNITAKYCREGCRMRAWYLKQKRIKAELADCYKYHHYGDLQ